MNQTQFDQMELWRGLAALFACTVQTLNEADPNLRPAFVNNLDHLYTCLRDQAGGNHDLPVLELLSMTRDALQVLKSS